MMKHEGDYLKHAVDEDRLQRIPREHTTYAQMAARRASSREYVMQMPWRGHGA